MVLASALARRHFCLADVQLRLVPSPAQAGAAEARRLRCPTPAAGVVSRCNFVGEANG